MKTKKTNEQLNTEANIANQRNFIENDLRNRRLNTAFQCHDCSFSGTLEEVMKHLKIH